MKKHVIRLYSSTVDVGLFPNALGQERDAPLLERRSELVEIRSVAPRACRISRVALDLAHEVLDFGRNLPTGAADEGADFVRIDCNISTDPADLTLRRLGRARDLLPPIPRPLLRQKAPDGRETRSVLLEGSRSVLSALKTSLLLYSSFILTWDGF